MPAVCFVFYSFVCLLRKCDAGEEYTKAILENNKNLYGKLFEKYSGEGRLAFDNARESAANRENTANKPDGTGITDNSERKVRERGLDNNIPDIR